MKSTPVRGGKFGGDGGCRILNFLFVEQGADQTGSEPRVMRRLVERLAIQSFGLANVAGEVSLFRRGGLMGRDYVAMDVVLKGER